MPNLLAHQKSLYLKQHQDNPVDWHPYGPEALQKAREENKPIFLSIGYSSCHWCHVMAHESFEDQVTADFLNKNFINIKVDREEYPDLDSYYQQACQLFIKTGGWPLSAFLTPDMQPFFVGTYYPKDRRHPQAATFMDLLQELARTYKEDHQKVLDNAKEVTKQLKNFKPTIEKVEYPNHFPHPMGIMDAIKQFADKENGGYGVEPKFPHFAFYEWAIENMLEGLIDKTHGQHIIDTLDKMLMGGVFDHARGGIHRYSVDKAYLVPHFEKMLYDQSGLLRVLAKASIIYPSPLIYDALMNTLDYLEKEMISEEGYLFSAQDADSEGVEGLYFTYTYEELEDLINKNTELEAHKDELLKWSRVSPEGNFESKLNVISLDPKFKEEIFTQKSWPLIRELRKTILEDRKGRIPPATDNKGVASWNFMMISALCDVVQYCKIDPIKRKAHSLFQRVLEGSFKSFIEQDEQGKTFIKHTTTLNQNHPYFEDYVSFAEAMLRSYEITSAANFKQNTLDTLKYIVHNFYKEGTFHTRSHAFEDHQPYPNTEVSSYGSSFKSLLSTLIVLINRSNLLFPEVKDIFSEFLEDLETLKSASLRNPIVSGEALRAFSYPDNAYRSLNIPQAWTKNSEFIQVMNQFLPRFIFNYHEDNSEEWSICNHQSCELTGKGLEELKSNLLKPQDKRDDAQKN